MTERTFETSPQFYARIAGVLYLINIVTGAMGEMFIRNTLVVSGDAAATANNIIASESLWRIGIVGDLIMQLTDIPSVLLFYLLLKPVSKHLSMLAALFALTQTAVLVANKMNLLVPLFLLGNAEYLKVFDPNQLHTLAYLAIKAHGYGFSVGLIFFGVSCLVTGHLIRKSGYLPKILGVLIQIAGLSYLTNSFAMLLSPAFADVIFPFILVPAFIGESSLCLWLLVKGVNVAEWNKRPGIGAVSGASAGI